MDDTPEDRKAIQSSINQIVFYTLKDFDGKMKTKDWAQARTIPGPKSEGGGETQVGRAGKVFRPARDGARHRAAVARRGNALRPVP